MHSLHVLHLKSSSCLSVGSESGTEGHSWDEPSAQAVDHSVQMSRVWAHDGLRKRPVVGNTGITEALNDSTNVTCNSEFCWMRHSSTKKMDHEAARWSMASVYLALERFSGHGAFRGKTGRVLGSPRWLLTPVGCWAFWNCGKYFMKPVCDDLKCLSCTISPILCLLNSFYRRYTRSDN